MAKTTDVRFIRRITPNIDHTERQKEMQQKQKIQDKISRSIEVGK